MFIFHRITIKSHNNLKYRSRYSNTFYRFSYVFPGYSQLLRNLQQKSKYNLLVLQTRFKIFLEKMIYLIIDAKFLVEKCFKEIIKKL